jgi:hypothetical protein
MNKKQHMMAQGLFYLAQHHYNKCREFEIEMCKLLKVDDADHLSDAIYNNGTFDEGLKNMGLESPHSVCQDAQSDEKNG